jgi:hypothetical protein
MASSRRAHARSPHNLSVAGIRDEAGSRRRLGRVLGHPVEVGVGQEVGPS